MQSLKLHVSPNRLDDTKSINDRLGIAQLPDD
jgi:hypothetical protein